MTLSRKLVTLNANGLRNAKNRCKLFRQLKGKGEIVLLQETHSQPADEKYWSNLLGGGKMYFAHGDSNARGVAIYFDKTIDFQVKYTYRDEDGRLLIIVTEIDGIQICIINAYAPNLSSNTNDRLAHENFFENILAKMNDIKTTHKVSEFMLGGDFNLIRDNYYDAYGGSPVLYHRSINVIDKIIQEHSLSDVFRELNPTERIYTYSPGGLNVRNIFRRLDYILIPDTWVKDVTTTTITPAIHSDHRIVKIEFRKSSPSKGSGLWKHNDKLNENSDYIDEFNKNFPNWAKEADTLEDPRSRWDFLKYCIKGHSRQFSIKRAKSQREFKENAEKNMADIDHKLRLSPEDEGLALQYAQAKTTFDTILEEENESLRFRARVQVYEEGEKSTEYFFRQIKQNTGRCNISTLNINGKISDDSNEIKKAIYNFYRDLYKEEVNISNLIASDPCTEFLDNDMPKISNGQRLECDKNITNTEVRNILFKDLNKKKSPGNDGITVGLLQTRWELLEPYFMSCVNYAIEVGELSPSQRQGVVRLIEKKNKDRRNLENWRPISLLNVDTKIFSKLLANRIKLVLPDIISDEQTAFVKDRFIGENVQLIQGLTEYCKRKQEHGLILAIDFRKAFDSVSHTFLFKVLEHFGFGPNFIGMIKTLHQGAENAIMNEGSTTRYFKLERSCRQGDCLSPYLFILVMETLCYRIKHCSNIKGITCNNIEYKYGAYADDLTVFIKDRASLLEVINILKKFRKFSGLEININKTEGFVLGGDGEQFKNLNINLVSEIKITGVTFGYDSDRVEDLNFNPILVKMARRFNDWKGRNLSLLGKVLVSKAQGISQLVYIATMIMVPDWVIKQATSLVYKFIWGGPDKITRQLACKNYDQGGIRAPNIALLVDALHGTWIARFCKPGGHGWKNFMAEELAMVGCNKHCLTGNFSPNMDKKRNTTLAHAIKVWSKITKPANHKEINQILEASIWMNADICTRKGIPLCDHTRGHTLNKVKDLLNEAGYLASFDELTRKGLPQGDYLSWRSIITCISKKWKRQLEQHAASKTNTIADSEPNIYTPKSRTSEQFGPTPQAGNRDCTTGVGCVDQEHLIEHTTNRSNAIVNSTRDGCTPNTLMPQGTGPTPKAKKDSMGAGSADQLAISLNNSNSPDLIYIDDKPIPIRKIKCKDIYKVLLSNLKHDMQPFRSRVTPTYNLDDNQWTTLYTTPFQLTTNTKLRSFHFRLTHGLLYGNKQLNIFGYKDESNCQLCTTPLQTFQHLLIDCPAILELWNRIEKEFSNIIDEPLTNKEKELGYLEEDEELFIVRNLLLLIVRFYIYKCNLDNIEPTYTGLIIKLRYYEKIEHDIATRNDTVENHFLKWEEILNSLSLGTPI